MDSARQAAQEYLDQHPLGTDELWLLYWSNGGASLRSDFGAYLVQAEDPPEGDQQILNWALEDLVAEDAAWLGLAPAVGLPLPEILP